nr:MAG TPA: hypothetical protein [Caudoviricetes sp.]
MIDCHGFQTMIGVLEAATASQGSTLGRHSHRPNQPPRP